MPVCGSKLGVGVGLCLLARSWIEAVGLELRAWNDVGAGLELRACRCPKFVDARLWLMPCTLGVGAGWRLLDWSCGLEVALVPDCSCRLAGVRGLQVFVGSWFGVISTMLLVCVCWFEAGLKLLGWSCGLGTESVPD